MSSILSWFNWDLWVLFGFGAQFAFMMRFVIQWWASEKRQRSYVPVVFWYFSLTGGVMLGIYALIHLRDPVVFAGQSLGCLIYTRNLVLIYRRRRRYRRRRARGLARLMEDGLEAPNGNDNGNQATPAEASDKLAPASSTSDATTHA
jgi:lipid-A-disaccharide synthase-like uncharacterized protein